MIVTVTPNPSVDWTLEIPELIRGAVHRISGDHQEPSGKGVNVSRALTANAVPTLAVVPVGGTEGVELETLLRGEGVPFVAVPIMGRVRVNISLTEPDGHATKINAPGPTLLDEEVNALLASAASAGSGANWVLGSGSLPRGVPSDFYAQLGAAVAVTGARFAVDSSGAALVVGLAARPDVIKPNAPELAEAVGRSLVTVGDAVQAAEELRNRGARTVVVSLGRDGALLVDDDGALHAEAVVLDPKSTVGAGDAMLAGYLAGRERHDQDRAAALREAVAWGSGAVATVGSHVPAITDAHRRAVEITQDVEAGRLLSGT